VAGPLLVGECKSEMKEREKRGEFVESVHFDGI
jgi:hypothetical protein